MLTVLVVLVVVIEVIAKDVKLVANIHIVKFQIVNFAIIKYSSIINI
jgi:hypothetical protein